MDETKVTSLLSSTDRFPPLDKLFESWNNLQIEELLLKRSIIDYRNEHGETVLHLLTRFNRTSVLQKVINRFLGALNQVDDLGNTPFLNAAMNGSKKALRFLKDKGADIRCRNKDNVTALHFAVEKKNFYLVRTLISWGVEVNITTKSEGETPLILATKKRCENIVNFLLDNGAEVDIKCNKRRTAFWHAVSHGDGFLNCVVRLLKMKPDLCNVADIDEITPLMVASKSNSPKIIELLLLWKADVNTQCKNKRTALHYAAFLGHFKCVKRLIKARPRRNLQDINGRTALMAALYKNNVEILTYLLDHNVKPNIQCELGRSALHYAAAKGYLKSCIKLIEAGAIVDLKDKYGKTSFMLAATHGYIDVMDYLKGVGADIDMQDNNGKNALMCLAANTEIADGNVARHRCNIGNKIQSTPDEIAERTTVKFDETISYLISLNENVGATCNRGLTALHYAASTGNMNCITQLLEAKVIIDATDIRGETPLHKAASRGQMKVITVLLRRGAVENELSAYKKRPYDLACMGNHINCMWLFTEATHETDNEHINPRVLVRIARNKRKRVNREFTEELRLEFLDVTVDALISDHNASSIQLKSVKFCSGKLLVTTVDQASMQWLVNKIKTFVFESSGMPCASLIVQYLPTA